MPTSVNPIGRQRISLRKPGANREKALNRPDTTRKSRCARNELIHNAGFQGFIHSFRPENTKPSPLRPDCHYDYATAARGPELSREFLHQLPSQGTIPLVPRRLRPVTF